METSDAWIQERTGIKERRHIVPGGEDSTSSMGTKAGQNGSRRCEYGSR